MSFAPPYAKAGKKALDGAAGVEVIAAMTRSKSADIDRRLFKARPASAPATPRTSLADWRRLQGITPDEAAAARETEFQSDPLCMQSSKLCTTCGATRTYAPKGKTLPPFCDYAAEVTHECRRGVGADACGRAQALGGTISERRLCAPLADLTAMQRKSNPLIQFKSAAPVTGTAVVAMVAPLIPPPSPRLTLMDIVLHMQRQCRRRIIRRHRAACAVQQCCRLRHARRAAAATVLQQRARGYRMLSCAALADATIPTSQAHLESDTCSTTAVFGGRQLVASLSDSSSPPTPSTWRPLSAGDLGPSLTVTLHLKASITSRLSGWVRSRTHI